MKFVNNTIGNWTVIIECRDPAESLFDGNVTLIFRMNDTRVNPPDDGTCDVVLEVSWNQTRRLSLFVLTKHPSPK